MRDGLDFDKMYDNCRKYYVKLMVQKYHSLIFPTNIPNLKFLQMILDLREMDMKIKR